MCLSLLFSLSVPVLQSFYSVLVWFAPLRSSPFVYVANLKGVLRPCSFRFSLLRRHPPPSRRSFDQLIAAARSVGVELQVDSSLALAKSLDRAELAGNAYFNKLLRILTTRCMMQVRSFSHFPPSRCAHYCPSLLAVLGCLLPIG